MVIDEKGRKKDVNACSKENQNFNYQSIPR
jgi:hypothetical protein